MSAAKIARQLGGAEDWGSREWRCNCPLCARHDLTLRARGDRLDLRCHAGCDDGAVLGELVRRGLYGGQA